MGLPWNAPGRCPEKAKLFNRQHLGSDVLAVAAPWQGAHIAFPAQLDMFARGTHQLVGHGLISYGELQLIGMQSFGTFPHRFETGLDNLPFVSFEYDTFLLKLVQVASIDYTTIDEKETEKDKRSKR